MKTYSQLKMSIKVIEEEDVITMSVNTENGYDDTAEDIFSE